MYVCIGRVILRLFEVLQSEKIQAPKTYAGKMKSNQQQRKEKVFKGVDLYVGYEVSSNIVQAVINFCEDFNVPNCVADDVQIPLLVSKRYSPDVKYDESILKKDIYIDSFELKIKQLRNGDSALVAFFDSEDLQDIRRKFAEEYNIQLKSNSKYRPYFVISSNIENKNLNLDNLTIRFNQEYLPYGVATEAFISAYQKDEKDSDSEFVLIECALNQGEELVNYNHIDFDRIVKSTSI